MPWRGRVGGDALAPDVTATRRTAEAPPMTLVRDVETPAGTVDVAIMDANIRRVPAHMTSPGPPRGA
jgi:hypothetical protein